MCVVSKQKGTQLTVLYCRLGCLLLFWREVRGRQETMITSYQYCEQRTRARARLLEYFFVSPSTVRDYSKPRLKPVSQFEMFVMVHLFDRTEKLVGASTFFLSERRNRE